MFIHHYKCLRLKSNIVRVLNLDERYEGKHSISQFASCISQRCVGVRSCQWCVRGNCNSITLHAIRNQFSDNFPPGLTVPQSLSACTSTGIERKETGAEPVTRQAPTINLLPAEPPTRTDLHKMKLLPLTGITTLLLTVVNTLATFRRGSVSEFNPCQ